MKILVLCSWCNTFLKFKDFPGDKPPKLPISHGICPGCKLNVDEEIKNLKGGHYETQYQRGTG